MPRDFSEGPVVIALSGERAQRLADRLLAPRPDPMAERLWDDLSDLAGHPHRLSHDWDPDTGRLTISAGR